MNQQEYEHIVPELRPRLTDIGRQFFYDEEIAEDIAQETLMRLWMLRERIEPLTDIAPLAVRMAKNLCVSEWRKQKVRRGNSLHADCNATLRPRVGELTTSEDIHRDMVLREEIARLRQAVGQLKPAEQRLFRMRHEAEMDIQQISTATGIGVRSVSAMLSTAKRKLLEILNPKGGSL
jgi:RNA polymerase sigma factor (sigma-70 family)